MIVRKLCTTLRSILHENAKPRESLAITNFGRNDVRRTVALIPPSEMLNEAIYIAITMIYVTMKPGRSRNFPHRATRVNCLICGMRRGREHGFAKRTRRDESSTSCHAKPVSVERYSYTLGINEVCRTLAIAKSTN